MDLKVDKEQPVRDKQEKVLLEYEKQEVGFEQKDNIGLEAQEKKYPQ